MSSEPVESGCSSDSEAQPTFGNSKSNPTVSMSAAPIDIPLQLLAAVSSPVTRLERSIPIIGDDDDEKLTARRHEKSSWPVTLLSVDISKETYEQHMKDKSLFR